ncbi:hypothetical protein SAMN05428940_3391 [Streptomyces sp. 2133.1]|nr:hypothetical protein SAMN05428940_3391 [Streptomyces sp. 2133.1]
MPLRKPRAPCHRPAAPCPGEARRRTIRPAASRLPELVLMAAGPETWANCSPHVALHDVSATVQAAHPAYRQSLDRLCEMGVLIGSYGPHRPAGGGADRFHWEEALELLAPEVSGRA